MGKAGRQPEIIKEMMSKSARAAWNTLETLVKDGQDVRKVGHIAIADPRTIRYMQKFGVIQVVINQGRVITRATDLGHQMMKLWRSAT